MGPFAKTAQHIHFLTHVNINYQLLPTDAAYLQTGLREVADHRSGASCAPVYFTSIVAMRTGSFAKCKWLSRSPLTRSHFFGLMLCREQCHEKNRQELWCEWIILPQTILRCVWTWMIRRRWSLLQPLLLISLHRRDYFPPDLFMILFFFKRLLFFLRSTNSNKAKCHGRLRSAPSVQWRNS